MEEWLPEHKAFAVVQQRGTQHSLADHKGNGVLVSICSTRWHQVPGSAMAGSYTPAVKSQRMTSKAQSKSALSQSLCQFLAQYCPALILNAEINTDKKVIQGIF